MSRKYRQRGYQEDDRESADRKRATAPAGRDGPRGRGLGAPTRSTFKCARCGVETSAAVERDSICSGCGSDLHTCSNCRHFDTSARYECRKPVADRIAAKSSRNHCPQFEPKLVKSFANDAKADPEDARAAFDALFDL